jgi:hypothetical protein
MRKLIIFLTIVLCLVLSYNGVFANGGESPAEERDLSWYISQPRSSFAEEEANPLAETEQIFAEVTNREYSVGSTLIHDTDSFILFGICPKPGAKLVAAVLNGSVYEVLYSSDEGKGIMINEGGLFHTEHIKLKVGLNKIKLVAYLDEALESPEPGKNIQITYVSVRYSPGGKEQVLNSNRSITDVIQGVKKSLSGE